MVHLISSEGKQSANLKELMINFAYTLWKCSLFLKFLSLKKTFMVFIFCFPFALNAQVPKNMKQRGQAVFSVLGLKLYDARLFTPGGGAFEEDDESAIEITYARRFSKNAIVNLTMEEIVRVGRSSPSATVWRDCFQTVQRGDRYVVVSEGVDRINFSLNGQKTCTLEYPDIKSSFMGIFIGENTLSRTFTKALLGE